MSIRKLLSRAGPLAIALSFALFFGVVDWLQEERGWHDWFGYKLELKLLDQMFEWRGPVAADPKVVIAAIDERSLEAYGQWGSWRRTLFKLGLDRLRAAGADTIGWDIVFAGPRQYTDTSMGQRLENILRDIDPGATSEGLGTGFAEVGASLDHATDAQKKATLSGDELRRLDASVKERHRSGMLAAGSDTARARQRLDGLQQLSQRFVSKTEALVENIRQEAEGESPDQTLAEGIEEHSGNTVLGFIALFEEEEEELSRPDVSDLNFCRVASSALDSIAVGWGLPGEGEQVAVPIFKENSKPGLQTLIPKVKGGFVSPNPEFANAAQNLGTFALNPDPDGVCRRLPLLVYYTTAAPPRPAWTEECTYEVGNFMLPSLALSTASQLLEAPPVPIVHPIFKRGIQSVSFSVSRDVIERLCRLRKGTMDDATLQDCVRSFPGERIADSVVIDLPTTPTGEMLVNYYGPEKTTFPRISYSDVVAGTFKPELVKGKVVLVAATAIATHDQRVTPFSAFAPGVEVHAAAIQNIIDGRFLSRHPLAIPFELLFMLSVALLLGLLLRRVSVPIGIGVTLAIAVAYWAINTFVLFRQGYWFYLVLPFLQIFLTWAGITVFGYLVEGREKKRITAQFGTYVSPDYVRELIDNPDVIGLSGAEREMSVLFSDIRGFTTMSERLAPEELTRFLNEYLTPMTYCLQRNQGTLDKYMGDAIMAFFGAPKWFDDHPVKACLTAIEMMDELRDLRKKWRSEGKPDIDIGIGINSGKMRVGNMGSEAMRNYTVLGDNVNLGSRLEGLNKQYATNIIASQTTFEAAGALIYGRELDSVAVKGKKEPVRIFEVMGRGRPVDWQAELIGAFERGLVAYRKQEWEEALELFKTCLRIRKEATGTPDGCSHMYLERVHLLQKNPPRPGLGRGVEDDHQVAITTPR
ncbi:MAG: adenylate/guanylate cyclase domain-containing protein [Pseudomonadota bacterium]